jgi:uncharacterized protein YjbJ (UPF0337 family)
MNKDSMVGKLEQLAGEVQKKWGKLIDSDIQEIKGDIAILEGKLREKYGYTIEEAKENINDFFHTLKS